MAQEQSRLQKLGRQKMPVSREENLGAPSFPIGHGIKWVLDTKQLLIKGYCRDG